VVFTGVRFFGTAVV